MKNIFLFSITLLFLTSCLLLLPQADSTPEPTPPAISPTDRSVYKDGLIPEYQNILNKLPYASMYDIKFILPMTCITSPARKLYFTPTPKISN
ncbi:MAG: hypothetical protein IPL71_13430 [Anaerolineales bacterium]|uniref:hypothetical protein n=1 Tax=Candidatus Villigracilis proximus TaxID=3140683 RepID=UPI0031365018|nr:hypothetical protein [Anaerolineales bacterium]